MLLNTLTYPKYVLVIWLPSSPHTRRNIRHCSSIFEKKRISFYTDAFFSPLSCPTIPSIRSFKATEKLKTIHSFVICKVSLFSDGFKENIYFTTLSPKLQFVINRSHHMKWRYCVMYIDAVSTIYLKDLLNSVLKKGSEVVKNSLLYFTSRRIIRIHVQQPNKHTLSSSQIQLADVLLKGC